MVSTVENWARRKTTTAGKFKCGKLQGAILLIICVPTCLGTTGDARFSQQQVIPIHIATVLHQNVMFVILAFHSKVLKNHNTTVCEENVKTFSCAIVMYLWDQKILWL